METKRAYGKVYFVVPDSWRRVGLIGPYLDWLGPFNDAAAAGACYSEIAQQAEALSIAHNGRQTCNT